MTGELSHARVVVGHYAHVRDRLDAAVFTVLAHTSKSLQVLLGVCSGARRHFWT
jgi:hypothetical protein